MAAAVRGVQAGVSVALPPFPGSCCAAVSAPGSHLALHSRGGARNGGCSKVVAMEPQSKVQKLDHHDDSTAKVVLASQALRVKKLAPEAILPARGSALAAGYDLSRSAPAAILLSSPSLGPTPISFLYQVLELVLWFWLGLYDGVLPEVPRICGIVRVHYFFPLLESFSAPLLQFSFLNMF
jgi:hypothetical protein